MIRSQAIANDFDCTLDASQRILDLMCQPCRHFADGRELLCLSQMSVKEFLFGNILQNRGITNEASRSVTDRGSRKQDINCAPILRHPLSLITPQIAFGLSRC